MSEFRETALISVDEVAFETITESLATAGFAIVPQFFLPDVALLLLEEVQSLWQEGELEKAAIGRGKEKQRVAEVRTDFIHWLEPTQLTVAQTLYWDRMQRLMVELNRSLILGLFELEAHLARFTPGGYYKPHLDQHQKTRARILSAVTYLDAGWEESDGGALRLYTNREAGVEGEFIDVYPEPGKLVLFLSAEFWHEVRLAKRPRHSLTGWFRRREEPVPGMFV